MKIFVTGLCTLHWGRLEYGNIGNYYIIEPLFKELIRVFPQAEICTTFQMTESFVLFDKIEILPLEIFYAWNEKDLNNALTDYALAEDFSKTGVMPETTPFLSVVMQSDLVIEVSGDMWGDYAEHVGHDRFLVQLLKSRAVQLLNVPIILFAGSQGPFSDTRTQDFARLVYENYTCVMAREPKAIANVKQCGFSIENTRLYACPAFLFEPMPKAQMTDILQAQGLQEKNKPVVGLVVCGFNLPEPYDKWPRENDDFAAFVRLTEFIVNYCNATVVLLGHSNGFDLPPNFKLKQGRDYPIVKQIQNLVYARGFVAPDDVHCVDQVYLPSQIKGIIREFDMLVTGRVHASVAAISQCVPTVFVRYISQMKSTKIQGFASLVNMQQYVVDPEYTEMESAVKLCWSNKSEIKQSLQNSVAEVKATARRAFDDMNEFVIKGREI